MNKYGCMVIVRFRLEHCMSITSSISPFHNTDRIVYFRGISEGAGREIISSGLQKVLFYLKVIKMTV